MQAAFWLQIYFAAKEGVVVNCLGDRLFYVECIKIFYRKRCRPALHFDKIVLLGVESNFTFVSDETVISKSSNFVVEFLIRRQKNQAAKLRSAY